MGPLTNCLSFRLHFRNDSLIIWWLSDKTRTEMYLRGTTRAKRSRENRINFCLNSFRPTLSGPTQEQMEQKIYRGSTHIFQPNCSLKCFKSDLLHIISRNSRVRLILDLKTGEEGWTLANIDCKYRPSHLSGQWNRSGWRRIISQQWYCVR